MKPGFHRNTIAVSCRDPSVRSQERTSCNRCRQHPTTGSPLMRNFGDTLPFNAPSCRDYAHRLFEVAWLLPDDDVRVPPGYTHSGGSHGSVHAPGDGYQLSARAHGSP
jgi:hypothetical protein